MISILFITNFDSIRSAVVCAVLSYTTSLHSHHRTVKLAALFNRGAMKPLNTARSKPDSLFLEYSKSFFFFITLQSFLLKYEWLCLSSVQIIYLCVSRPLVELSDLKYSEGLSVCHVCFVSTAFLSRSDVHLLAHYFGLFYCFELLQLHSRHTETSICVQLGTRKPYRRQSTSVSFLN